MYKENPRIRNGNSCEGNQNYQLQNNRKQRRRQ
nr:MAG TPA: hypothetical protein [Caudoviricetes sp.]